MNAPPPSAASRRLKIAVICPSVGVVQRGFERYLSDLYEVVREDFDVTLFKGGGPTTETERIPPFIRRDSAVFRLLPVHRLFGRTAMHSECFIYGLSLLPYLRAGRYDIVHTIDPPLARFLFNLRRRLGLQYRLLYTHGCTMPPGHYPPADHLHHVTQRTFDEALAYGYAAETMTLVPCGLNLERFQVTKDRASLRRAYGIDEDAFVILSVAALNRWQKRIDYLIDEVAGLIGEGTGRDSKTVLLIDGSRDHPDHVGLIESASQRLGDRCRISHVASDKVGELYHLADVMAHTALFEAFGLSLVEAASCGLPVLAHNADHFRWLLPNPECWIDMARPGALASRLRALRDDPSALSALRCAEPIQRRFSWPQLRRQHAALYRRLAETAGGAQKETDHAFAHAAQ